MKIFLVRHGETNYNIMGLVSSEPGDRVFLTDNGEKQAKKMAEELKAETIDIVYISELLRTKQTAEIINAYHRAPVITDKRLNDIKTGMENGSYLEYQSFRAAAEDVFTYRPTGGESSEDVYMRARDFWNDLLKTEEENILIVSSEHVLIMLLSLFDKVDPRTELDERIRNCQLVTRVIGD